MTNDPSDKSPGGPTPGLAELVESMRALTVEIIGRFGVDGAEEALSAVEAAIREAGPVATMSGADAPKDRSKYSAIIGDSPAMLSVLGLLDRVAASDLAVLIQGESGTGKELIAKAIHDNSNRSDKPFITENCAAIPETLQESELFGYKRGAFTGADRDRKGLFQMADKGTLFLDEVGDMSLNMQKKLLRALQDGEIRPVGATKSVYVDVRVVSASNRILKEMADRGEFREDLYYRLNGVTLELPPLRDRAEDVPKLAEHFVTRIAAEMGTEAPPIRSDARNAMRRYRWPGNIRELENEMRRCLALLGPDKEIGIDLLSDELRG